jgi:hypothetical protein
VERVTPGGYGHFPLGMLLEPPVDGVVVVVDGVVVVVVVDGVVVVDEPEAALAIAAPPPAITPTVPSVTSAVRYRFTVLHLLSVVGLSVLPVDRRALAMD